MSDQPEGHRKRPARRRSGAGLIITIDVEDHTIPPAEPRFDRAIGPLLEVLDGRRVKATFFVVGELVARWDHQLRELIAAGHEVGLHGFTHRHLQVLGPGGFSDELRRGVDALGERLGVSPAGFRAPYCSLTEDTPWAPDLLAEAGFTYSSSVMPAWNPMAGYPGAPARPFRWRCGLLELPSPVFGIGRLALPVLGGAYLRLMPGFVVRRASRNRSADRGDWTYAHPYDFDTTEHFFRRPDQSWIEARLLFGRRKHMLRRFSRLISAETPTLGEFANGLHCSHQLPVFGP
jgi:peptidoglycan/xylan/chitin deacetylase (PgdA/CDA1 family)